MEENFLDDFKVSVGKVYSQRAIITGTFLCSFLAGGYMMYKNFIAFGQPDKARMTIVGIIGCVGILLAAFFIPAMDRIPNIVYSLFFTFLASFFVHKYQKDLISQHQEDGGLMRSTGEVLAVCVISILLLAGVLIGLFFLSDVAIPDQH